MIQVDIKMNQLQIGMDMRVELQIPPSLKPHYIISKEILHLEWGCFGKNEKIALDSQKTHYFRI